LGFKIYIFNFHKTKNEHGCLYRNMILLGRLPLNRTRDSYCCSSAITCAEVSST
jgi:hypothetical protein